MKRLIKYWYLHGDDAKFSHSSTKFEVLPELVDDDAGFDQLKALAKKHGLRIGRSMLNPCNRVTHAINMVEKHKREYFGRTEEHTVYLGFITLKQGTLKPTNKLGSKISKKQAWEIVNAQEYGVADVGEHCQEDMQVIVKYNHSYYTEMNILGYSHEAFEKAIKAEDYGFDDDTMRCGECGLLDSRDNGYTYNFREAHGDLLGVNCGCYDEFCKANFAEEYADNHKKAIERATAIDLEREGKIKRLETFIGGMVDGRGGYFCGKPTREGTPEAVLKEYQERMPKKTFVFIHEESGQFQSYFSIAEVVTKKQTRKAA